ncbi:MAG: hypothetical protein HOQ17_06745 [Gemmatimonadaceae bacterium]|nr:hypothetical protein [Gemmatimonadaceae bacterium]NUP54576.1 hypothetical protein [Gemmatimonadaceae bacterium]NUR36166.1 hypothetical protein [Gemmatimonadaceae bacterium]NUS32744.1 hypothetical protein [Gemmatimonadaceae bacterium]
MVLRWSAWALVLALGALWPGSAEAQAPDTAPVSPAPPRSRKLGTLGQNYPNPFKPETFIPFTIDDCNGPGGHRVVSLRVYNVLAQLVATPVLHGADKPLASLRLSCGEYLGFWDGRVSKSRRAAAAGVYVYELVVDGERSSRKMFMAK